MLQLFWLLKKMSLIVYFFVVATLLGVTESLSKNTPGTSVLPPYQENGSGSGLSSASASGSGFASGSGIGLPDFFYPFGEDVGDTRLHPIDDGSSEGILLNTPVVFYGKSEPLAFVSSNGVLSFQETFNDCCAPRHFPRSSVPLIAPFWHDINTITGGSIYYRQTLDPELLDISLKLLLTFKITSTNFIPKNLLILTWNRVPPFSNGIPSKQSNTFQLVIITNGVISSAFFFYGDIQWGKKAQLGFNAGDGVNSFSLPGALTDDTVNIEEQSNVGHPGIFAYRIDDLTIVPITEQPTDPMTKPHTPSQEITTMIPITISTDSSLPRPFFAPFGSSVGDQLLPPGDDTTEGPITLDQSFRFFGKNESEAYIGINGVISFQQSFTECCEPRDFPRGPPPLIAPFWHDVSTSNGGNIFYRQTADSQLLWMFQLAARMHSLTFNPNSIFIVTWDRVAPFSDTNEGLSNTFQVWLGSDGRESFVLFLYRDIQWGENAQIGFNAGDNVRSFSVIEALMSNTLNIGFHSNINRTGVFSFQVDNFGCPAGTYQSQPQEECVPCPLNTNTTATETNICQCLPGYFRNISEGAEIPCTEPPSKCRNIRAISINKRNINVSWEIPVNIGRNDFYYIVEYSDGENIESNTVFSENKVVEYYIDGLKPGTDYTIIVTAKNGVSNQDRQNVHLRRCELTLKTDEDRPSRPIDVQAFCSIIVWGAPLNPNGDVTGFEVQIFIPSIEVVILKEIPRDRTFYIVEEDGILGNLNALIRVRARTKKGSGDWSDRQSLGCDDSTVRQVQTCPPCEYSTCETPTTPNQSVYFTLNGQVITNNSVLSLSKIGEGESALLCKTDMINCCGTVPNRFGQFYYPNGIIVPIKSRAHQFYRDRGDQVVRLNRREGTTSPTGTYLCEIPDENGIIQKLYIDLA